MTTPPLPEQIELHRDRMWRRDEELRVESALDAERFIEDVGFANTLGYGEGLGCELQLISLSLNATWVCRNLKKDCSVNPHPQPFSQWEKGGKDLNSPQ